MCGVLTVIVKKPGMLSVHDLVRATTVVAHRGPDDAGFLLWNQRARAQVFAGPGTDAGTVASLGVTEIPQDSPFSVGLSHRRLSIIDLSHTGHQPMVHSESGVAITYNGEIYNYRELRRELEQLGHPFRSSSDTEVLLKAWVEWGTDCVHRLNGMFAFVILDQRNGGTVFAVRDRFGIKPLYWTQTPHYIAFASEIKQLRCLPGFSGSVNLPVAADYLVHGSVDAAAQTFDNAVHALLGGQMATVALRAPEVSIHRWYQLEPRTWAGSDRDAIARFLELMTDSVKLQLRSDVPVGSCLSGGLDSSTIVCLANQIRADAATVGRQVTVTACFDQAKYDEWRFAEEVVKHSPVEAHRVLPSAERLREELELFLRHQDEPVGSTSQFSQWCVFAGAARLGLKVMLDGQGADEILAGYTANELPVYRELLARNAIGTLLLEALAFRRLHGTMPLGYLLHALDREVPQSRKLFRRKWRIGVDQAAPAWLAAEALPAGHPAATDSLRENLTTQVEGGLRSLLRYEDRSSMAFSIESRVPFLDHRLVEFTLGLPLHLIYRRADRKVVLREAMRGVIPEAVRTRRDKMGFVTPEEAWLKTAATAWFREKARAAIEENRDIFNTSEAIAELERLITGERPFSFLPWRMLCFGEWARQSRLSASGAWATVQ